MSIQDNILTLALALDTNEEDAARIFRNVTSGCKGRCNACKADLATGDGYALVCCGAGTADSPHMVFVFCSRCGRKWHKLGHDARQALADRITARMSGIIGHCRVVPKGRA